ncbi:MAG: hypothetical protein V2B20_18420 [Pseudomonadota bacterium]
MKYDANPDSFLGRLWRWHANWCPGWKKYLQAMPAERRAELVGRYKMGDKFKG